MTPDATPTVFVLCGALGSGKTTLLTDYLRRPEAADTGVIVNEVGAVSVDGALVAAGRPGLQMATLSNGCVCCSLGNDLAETVERLMAAKARTGRPLRRIVLETSGLARPGPVLRALSELRHLAAGVVSTYDCRADWLGAPASAAEAKADAMAQLAAANAVVLTKAELVEPDARQRMAEQVRGLNPFARVVVAADRDARAAEAFIPPADGRPAVAGPFASRPHPDVLVLLVDWAEPADWPTIEDWLEELAGFCGQRLLRAKGFLAVAGCRDRVLVQGVGTTFDTPRRIAPGADLPRGLVIIARDLGAAEFQHFLQEAPGSPALVSHPRHAP